VIKVEDLIEVLQHLAKEHPGIELEMGESSFDWEPVLYYIPNPADADHVEEIRI